MQRIVPRHRKTAQYNDHKRMVPWAEDHLTFVFFRQPISKLALQGQ